MTRTSYDALTGKTRNYTAEEEAAADKLKAAKDADDAANGYKRDRAFAHETGIIYPDLSEQLDLLWHAIDADADLKVKLAGFYDAIKKVKEASPKP